MFLVFILRLSEFYPTSTNLSQPCKKQKKVVFNFEIVYVCHSMKINTLHIVQQNIYKTLALFCAVWLIFSTCSMQTSLAHLIQDNAVALEQPTKTNKSKKQTTVTERNCHQNSIQDNQDTVLQKAGWDFSSPFVALLVSTFLVFFLGIRLTGNHTNHPLYQDTSQLQGKLPLFIAFQNLRI